MKTNSTSANVSEWKTAFTGKTIAIATALVMVLSFGALGAYGAGEGAENEAGTLTTDDPTAVLVNVTAPEAAVTVVSQVLPGEASGLLVPVNVDFTFEVAPIEGYEVVDVSINGATAGDGAGSYTIPAADVRDTIDVVVTSAPIAPADAVAPVEAELIPVTLMVEEATWTFDGAAHAPILKVLDEAGNVIEGWYALGNIPTFTDVTETQPVVCTEATVYDAEDVDVTQLCDITFVPGSVTITPATIKIETPSAEKVFDSKALVAQEAVFEPPYLEGQAFEDVINAMMTFEVTGSQTDVGSSQNTYSIDWGAVNLANFVIEENLGTLTVTQNEAPIVISGPTLSQVYNGQPLVAEVADVAVPAGFEVEAVVSGSITDVGTAESVVEEYRILDAEGADVTATFDNIQVQKGTLSVTPASITVATPSATKVYDGTELTATGGDWIDGFVNDETATATITGSQTEVGKSENTFNLEWDGTAKESNYQVYASLGTLEVLRIDPGQTPLSEGDNSGGTAVVNPSDVGGGSSAVGGASAGPTAGGTAGTGTAAAFTPSAPSATPIAGTPGVNYLSESASSEGAGAAAAGQGEEPASAVDAVAEGMQNVARGVIGEDPIPLTAPATTELAEDGTPLGAFDAPMNNWLRWYVVVGILGTALYGAAVLARRRNFTRGLENQENAMLGASSSEAAEAAVPAEAVRSV